MPDSKLPNMQSIQTSKSDYNFGGDPYLRKLYKRKIVRLASVVLVPWVIIFIILIVVGLKLKKDALKDNVINTPPSGSGLGVGDGNVDVKEGPESTVIKFLEDNLKGDKASARMLFSKNTNKDAFTSTLSSEEDSSSLYGKDFTYKIYDVYMENNNAQSLISVQITEGGKSYVNAYSLVKEGGNWLLVDRITYTPF